MEQKYFIQPSNSDLLHYGILGMKWGVRKYQNKDGTLTAKGRERYGLKGARTGYKVDNVIGFASLAGNANRLKEYNYQKQLAKQDPNYNKDTKKEIIERIRNERSSEAAGAFLKDLGYDDTPQGRKEVLEIFDSKELKKMSNINEISRAIQVGLLATSVGITAAAYKTAAVSGFMVGNRIANQVIATKGMNARTQYEVQQALNNYLSNRAIQNPTGHGPSAAQQIENARRAAQGRIITENILKENIETEHILTENILTENILTERTIPGNTSTWNNVTTWDNVPISTFDNEYLNELYFNSLENQIHR